MTFPGEGASYTVRSAAGTLSARRAVCSFAVVSAASAAGEDVLDDPAAGPRPRCRPGDLRTADRHHVLPVTLGIAPADETGVETAGTLHLVDDADRVIRRGPADRRGRVQHQRQVQGREARVLEYPTDRCGQMPHLIGADQLGGVGDDQFAAHPGQHRAVVVDNQLVFGEVLGGVLEGASDGLVRLRVGQSCRRPRQRVGLDDISGASDQHLGGGADEHRPAVIGASGGGQVHCIAVSQRRKVDHAGGDEKRVDLVGEGDIHRTGQDNLAQPGVLHRPDRRADRHLMLFRAGQRKDTEDLQLGGGLHAPVVRRRLQRTLALEDRLRDGQGRPVSGVEGDRPDDQVHLPLVQRSRRLERVRKGRAGALRADAARRAGQQEVRRRRRAIVVDHAVNRTQCR